MKVHRGKAVTGSRTRSKTYKKARHGGKRI